MAAWFLAGGAFLLLAGSEALLRGFACAGRAMRLALLPTGILFLAVAACGPNFAMALAAQKIGAPELVLPLVVGTNILTLLLLLGLGAIASPLSTSPKVLVRDGGALLVAAVALAFLAADGMLSRHEGIGLVAGGWLFLILTFAMDWRRPPETSIAMQRAEFFSAGTRTFTGSVFLLVLGLVLLGLGASFAFVGGITWARDEGLAPVTTALTLLAAVTALPSILAALIAMAARRTQLIVGHFFGIALFNILVVAGSAAILNPLPVSEPLHVDIVVMLAATALLLPLLAARWRLGRLQGAMLISCYAAYLGFVGWNSGMIRI